MDLVWISYISFSGSRNFFFHTNYMIYEGEMERESGQLMQLDI